MGGNGCKRAIVAAAIHRRFETCAKAFEIYCGSTVGRGLHKRAALVNGGRVLWVDGLLTGFDRQTENV